MVRVFSNGKWGSLMVRGISNGKGFLMVKGFQMVKVIQMVKDFMVKKLKNGKGFKW